jgi:uncharacterized membrane protein YcaP (DUF421 family)
VPIEILHLSGIPLALVRGVLLTAIAFAWTLLLVRIVGLRSFAKMTAFDFVATVATASLIAQAATRSDWGDLAQSLAGIGAVFLAQWLLATLRLESGAAARAIRNEPLLLMIDGEFLEEPMRQSRVSRANLVEKIRASGATRLDEVRAVVLETTGDLSVIAGEQLDPRLMEGVRGFPERRR